MTAVLDKVAASHDVLLSVTNVRLRGDDSATYVVDLTANSGECQSVIYHVTLDWHGMPQSTNRVGDTFGQCM